MIAPVPALVAPLSLPTLLGVVREKADGAREASNATSESSGDVGTYWVSELRCSIAALLRYLKGGQ